MDIGEVVEEGEVVIVMEEAEEEATDTVAARTFHLKKRWQSFVPIYDNLLQKVVSCFQCCNSFSPPPSVLRGRGVHLNRVCPCEPVYECGCEQVWRVAVCESV